MLQSLLAEDRPLLADGAIGANFFGMGLASGDSPELWNAVHPERVQSLHQDFVDAGADVILTNSFGANRRRLALHKREGRVHELNRLAAEHARKVADAARRKVVVAHIHYSGTPELTATYARLAVDCGASIIGGCCGNTPAHVAAMRRGLDAHECGPRPDVEAIVAALGALVAPPAGEAAGRTRRRERA